MKKSLHSVKIFPMKFRELSSRAAVKSDDLVREYKSAHGVGPVSLGGGHLFVKKGLSIYFIDYSDAERIFRRIRCVNAKMCCDNGEIEFEYLVVMAKGRELIEVQLPGKKAAKILMDELKALAPEGNYTAP